jgi:hypothetical protein
MIPLSGWRALCDQFRKIYSADLPFVHHPTFLELLSAGQISNCTQDPNCSTDGLAGVPSDSVILLLSFLALTLRHCEIDFDWHKSREGRANDNLEQSKHCARLAFLYLRNFSSTEHSVTIESVQARLMLASCQWSMCQCISARHLLSEANSLLQEVRFIRESSIGRGQKPTSVAMSFEAELLGVDVVQDDPHGHHPTSDLEDEISRRTSWSLYLLDLRFSLGTSRTSLVPSCTETALPLPASEDCFQCNSSVQESATSQHESTTHTIDVNMNYSQQPKGVLIPPFPTTNHWRPSSSGDTNARGLEPSTTPLSYYLSWLSLLRKVTMYSSRRNKK